MNHGCPGLSGRDREGDSSKVGVHENLDTLGNPDSWAQIIKASLWLGSGVLARRQCLDREGEALTMNSTIWPRGDAKWREVEKPSQGADVWHSCYNTTHLS